MPAAVRNPAGHWVRHSITLQPSITGDNIQTSGNIQGGALIYTYADSSDIFVRQGNGNYSFGLQSDPYGRGILAIYDDSPTATTANAVVKFDGRSGNDYNFIMTANFGVGTKTPSAKQQIVGDLKVGDAATNYTNISTTGDVTFVGSAGFYPRRIRQTTLPNSGTGATEIDVGEIIIWVNSAEADKVWLIYNDTTSGIVGVVLAAP